MQRFDVQCGHTLLAGMVLVTVLSLMAASAMRTAFLEEKMAFNFQDKFQAQQAAESALAFIIDEHMRGSLDSISQLPGYVGGQALTGQPDWTANGMPVPVYQANSGLRDKPRAIIEHLRTITVSRTIGGGAVNRELARRFYRITTRGTGQSGHAVAMYQAVIER